jgi:hypothetical protein
VLVLLLVSEHCPNFIPNQVEHEWYSKSKPEIQTYFHHDPFLVDNVVDKANFTLGTSTVIPVRVRFKSDQVYYDSLAHFWKEFWKECWNPHEGDYMDKMDGRNHHPKDNNTDFPRLMIRMEDLVFFPQVVLKTICQCVGGSMRHPLVLRGDTSKKEPSKVAMISHIYTNRSQGMTFQDIAYASRILQDSAVIHALGYYADPRF